MASPQTGIFALGTASHTYLELDAVGPVTGLTTVGSRLSVGASDERGNEWYP